VSIPDVLLVTGGGRGIGAAIVRAAAARGYAVGFCYLHDKEAAAAVVQELEAIGGRVIAIQGDVADPTFAAEFFDEAQAELGAVTAFVNNAGITGRYGAFTDLPLATLRRTFDVNVIGAMLMAQEAVRRWRAAGIPGRLVNLSSVAATLGSPGEYVHYAASKAAIDALTIGLGKEVAPEGIRVNAIAAGTVYTDIHAAGGAPDRPARVVGRVPLQRIAEPGEIAAAALWLLSTEASYVAGTILRVSGGL
jgi:NAD(P)-dependent dehydrogenase (short-subunit alcohol dehydrogenase family)